MNSMSQWFIFFALMLICLQLHDIKKAISPTPVTPVYIHKDGVGILIQDTATPSFPLPIKDKK
jgi:hypothetical protein